MELDDNENDPNAVRRSVDRVRTTGSNMLDRARRRSAVVDGLASAVSHDAEVGGGVMAGALAFRLFLFLVPYVLFMFTLFGTAGEVAGRSPTDLASSVGISGLLAKGVLNTSSLSAGEKWTILFVSGYALVVAARSLVKTLVAAICLAWQMPRIRPRATSAGLLFIAYFTVTSLLTSGIARLRAASPTPGMALTIAWLVIPLLSVWWLMAKLPHRDAPAWSLLPGAVITAIGFQAMHLLTVLWIAPSATSKTETYGVLGISLATLAWCYLAGRLVVGSTVLNAALWRRYRERHPDVALTTDESGTKFAQRTRVWLRSALDLFR
ncbi:MAG: YihY/virulence factor BrkB family protein [Acidimicrobiia bacterium]|nr:YihY/virulence factor BrkB family protein [Acidimicrobiia bacterium]